MAKRNYKVTFTVISTHEYNIPECNSPEEAESIAEQYFADGDFGEADQMDVDSVDVVEDEEGDES